MRCSLRVSPRLPVQVETSVLAEQTQQQQQNHSQSQVSAPLPTPNNGEHSDVMDAQQQQSSLNLPLQQNNVLPGSAYIVNGAGASRVFQILYRNEEVMLRDVVHFRTHLLGKSQKLISDTERNTRTWIWDYFLQLRKCFLQISYMMVDEFRTTSI